MVRWSHGHMVTWSHHELWKYIYKIYSTNNLFNSFFQTSFYFLWAADFIISANPFAKPFILMRNILWNFCPGFLNAVALKWKVGDTTNFFYGKITRCLTARPGGAFSKKSIFPIDLWYYRTPQDTQNTMPIRQGVRNNYSKIGRCCGLADCTTAAIIAYTQDRTNKGTTSCHCHHPLLGKVPQERPAGPQKKRQKQHVGVTHTK